MQFNIEPGQTSWFDQTPEYKKLYFADQARKREVRLFYLHIPKTGGKYMNEVFKNYNAFTNLGHRKPPVHGVNTINFSTVRNPFSLLVSWYFHRLRGQIGLDGCVKIFDIKSFEEFVKKYCDPNFVWLIARQKMKNFMFWQIFNNDKCTVDYVLRNEYLDDALLDFCSKFDITPNIGEKVNTSEHKDYRTYYTDELIELVNEKCERELKLFDYDFDGPIKKYKIITKDDINENS